MYRYHHPVQQIDGARAMRLVRSLLREGSDEPNKVRTYVSMLIYVDILDLVSGLFSFVILFLLRPLVIHTYIHTYLIQVGVIGSSAGGHLAATTMAYNDDGQATSADPIEAFRCLTQYPPTYIYTYIPTHLHTITVLGQILAH